MNGRAYDYNLGRFLSVDPFIQFPGNSQSLNPYSYIMNNPMAGTDPSGYKALFDRKTDCAGKSESECNALINSVLDKLGAKSNGKKNTNTVGSTGSNASAKIAEFLGPGDEAECGDLCDKLGTTPLGPVRIHGGTDISLIEVFTFDDVDPNGDEASFSVIERFEFMNSGAVSSSAPEAFLIPAEKIIAGSISVLFKLSSRTMELLGKIGTGKVTKGAPDITKAYKRPSGATTNAQRHSVQGKPCVDCGAQTPRQFADHKDPLVKEYYRTGSINKTRMRDIGSVQPQCPTCSSRQGAELSRFSRQMKKELDLE